MATFRCFGVRSAAAGRFSRSAGQACWPEFGGKTRDREQARGGQSGPAMRDNTALEYDTGECDCRKKAADPAGTGRRPAICLLDSWQVGPNGVRPSVLVQGSYGRPPTTLGRAPLGPTARRRGPTAIQLRGRGLPQDSRDLISSALGSRECNRES